MARTAAGAAAAAGGSGRADSQPLEHGRHRSQDRVDLAAQLIPFSTQAPAKLALVDLHQHVARLFDFVPSPGPARFPDGAHGLLLQPLSLGPLDVIAAEDTAAGN